MKIRHSIMAYYFLANTSTMDTAHANEISYLQPVVVAFKDVCNIARPDKIKELWKSMQSLRGRVPMNALRFNLSSWYPWHVACPRYVALQLNMDLDDATNYSLYIIEATHDPLASGFVETGAFLEIRKDAHSIGRAVNDAIALGDEFPLYEKNMTYERYIKLPGYAVDHGQFTPRPEDLGQY